MRKYELNNFGTVVSLDLTGHEDFGQVVIELASGEIGRLIEILYENLPDKTEIDKKCRESLTSRLLVGKIKMEIYITPVLNKSLLKECKALMI
ncbi:MAG: hypothetical protein NTY86_18025 [Deltaproteobacteria bacterium]|nr:hypothetical protein [Deltaproteobacteria bacterium]